MSFTNNSSEMSYPSGPGRLAVLFGVDSDGIKKSKFESAKKSLTSSDFFL